MKCVGKINVILSWDDDVGCCCQFKRGRHQEDWGNMSRDEQIHAVSAMEQMADIFRGFIKKEVNK